MNERPSPYNLDEAERAMHDPDRNRNYETLRDSGCSHDLATALLGMGDEFSRLKAELAALKARRCETCKYGRRISDIAYGCKRTHADLVMWAHDGCSRWEQSKKKREAADV